MKQYYFDAFSMICAIAEISAASPATAATRDWKPNSEKKFCPPKCAASPNLNATRNANALAMNAETNAVQDATLLFITFPAIDVGRCGKLIGWTSRR